jgi:uncharacterized protein
MQEVAPVEKDQREPLMDVLRGFAILGIFIANLHYMSMYHPEKQGAFFSKFDDTVEYLQSLLIEGKFYSIFSILFGWGVSMQMSKVRAAGMSGTRFTKRRLGFMFLLGFLHALFLWTGDIVAFYAAIGFILLYFQNKSNRRILRWAMALILLPIPLYMMKMLWAPSNYFTYLFDDAGDWLQMNVAHLDPGYDIMDAEVVTSWTELWKLNVGGIFYRISDLLFTSRIPKVLGLFLIGFMIGRGGYYKKLLANQSLMMKITAICFSLGLFFNSLMARYTPNVVQYYNLRISGLYQTIAYAFGVAPLAIAYMTSIALLFENASFKRVLMLLRPAGQMAFTNYILQSLLGILIFQGIGLNLGGEFGPLAWTILAIVIFMLQIILSHIWLKKFRHGPVEWLWRCMTYGSIQPFRKSSLTHVATTEEQ